MKVIAKDVRDKLVEDLIVMSIDLKAREAKDKKVNDLQKTADRVPKLEKDLKEIQKELKVRKTTDQETKKMTVCNDTHYTYIHTGGTEAVISIQDLRWRWWHDDERKAYLSRLHRWNDDKWLSFSISHPK